MISRKTEYRGQETESKKLRSLTFLISRICLLLTSCALLVITAGCVTSGHVVKPTKVNVATADDVVRHIGDGKEKAHSLKGMASVNVETSKIDTTVSEVVIAKSPSSIRLETLGFFGSPMMVLASDGDVYNLAIGERFISGRLSSKKMVSAPFPLNLLEIDDIASIFLGSTPVIKFESSEISYLEKENVYAVTLRSGDGFKKQTIQIDAADMRLLKSEIADDGLGSQLSLTFGKYQTVNGVSFPKEIYVKVSPNPAAIRINYEDIEVNPPMDDSVFVLKPADGADVTILQR